MVVGFFANLAAMFTVEEFPFELLTAIDKNWVIGPKIKMPILSNAGRTYIRSTGENVPRKLLDPGNS